MATEIDDLDRVRESVGFESIVLLGHSWGGLLAMEYAIRHPGGVAPHFDEPRTCVTSRRPRIPRAIWRAGGLLRRTRRMDELRSDPGFQAGDVETEAEYYRIHSRRRCATPTTWKLLSGD